MSGAAYVQTSMADIPIVKAECRQKKESKNLSAILSMPEHPDVKRLNVVVNANAKTLYFAFCKPCEKGGNQTFVGAGKNGGTPWGLNKPHRNLEFTP